MTIIRVTTKVLVISAWPQNLAEGVTVGRLCGESAALGCCVPRIESRVTWHMMATIQETLSGLTRAEQAQPIECGKRMTTTDAEIVQAACNLHHEIRDAFGGQT